MTSFFGFSIASRGLTAQQRAIETLSHNIANANTPGYSRQVTTINASTPLSVSGRQSGMIGTGADATEITRQRNGFLDLQYRTENTKLGENDVVSNTISQVEGVFGEPSDSALSTMTEKYWTALQDLSLNPESIAARGSVSEAGSALADSLNSVHSNIKTIRDDLNLRVKNDVTDANILTSQIAGLNNQIINIVALGQQPNDLMDQRDYALDKLSKMMDARVVQGTDGAVKVSVAGRVLVEGKDSFPLSTALNSGAEGYVDIVATGGTTLDAASLKGEMKGLLDLRDGLLSDTDPNGVLTKLNDFAKGMATVVNTQHKLGFDLNANQGEDFFTSTNGASIDASNITVNPHIKSDASGLTKIAASASDIAGQGDNRNLLSILAIKNQLVMNGGKSTLADFYKESTTTLGVKGQAAARMVTNQQNLLDFVSGQRESTSGVNMDEEMSDLIRYQHAYNASAKVLSIMDTLLDGLIKGR